MATTNTLECDYLIIGAGATGMAFVDQLLHSTLHETFIMVDKHSKPGGHWNDAYDFVNLHQPAQYYGVSSKNLGKGGNKLAKYNEIRAYYDDVMEEFIGSGRVKFFPQCEYKGNDHFQSMLAFDIEFKVEVRRKTVDASYAGSGSVPSTRAPEFTIAEGVHVKPINGLSHTKVSWEKYVVIGGGKTGIDAVLYLLDNCVLPDQITWIIPNDYWLLNRRFYFVDGLYDLVVKALLPSVIGSQSYDEVIRKWEEVGYIMRIDINIEPKNFRGGTVSYEEMEKLRKIKNIVRKGRVEGVEPDKIVFTNGSIIKYNLRNTFYVDCTSNGVKPSIPKPIFNGKSITLQHTLVFQSMYSVSCTAALERCYPDDEARKNNALGHALHMDTNTLYCIVDLIKDIKQSIEKHLAIRRELGIWWTRKNRLNMYSHLPWYRFLQINFHFRK